MRVSKVRELRFFKGLSQWQIALAAGMSQTKLSLIERGFIHPTEADKERIAEILETKIEDLFPEAQ